MRISLKNIAKIKEAIIEIKGITVIAGENNTGKSTIGKALYSVYNTFSGIDDKIEKSKRSRIEQILDRLGLNEELHLQEIMKTQDRNSLQLLLNDLHNQRNSTEDRASEWEDTIFDYDEPDEEIVNRIYLTLNLSKDDILKSILISHLKEELGNQINNIFRNETGVIELEIKSKNCSIVIIDNKIEKIVSPFKLDMNSVYFDDPFILDRGGFFFFDDVRHRKNLHNQLFGYSEKNMEEKEFDIDIDKILREQRIEKIEEKLNVICSGAIETDNFEGAVYKYPKSGKSLDLASLSTGLKTFVILKTLISKGYIEEKGLIIFDEPEVHLHPAWQIYLAELIAILQKEFHLHILINSHSPYFINAIEVYAQKHGTSEKVKYYLAELQSEGRYEEEMVIIEDVSYELDRIYSKLSKPFDDLEEEEFSASLKRQGVRHEDM